MNPNRNSGEDLFTGLVRLASVLTEDDLDDPEIYGLVRDLVSALDPKPPELPPELIQQLGQLQDKAERFRQAALLIGATRPDLMDKLVQSMKEAGLLKHDRYSNDMRQTAKSLDVSSSHILLFPVTIRGQATDPNDPSLPQYHTTLKWLGSHPSLRPEEVQWIVDRYRLHPPLVGGLQPKNIETTHGPAYLLILEGNFENLRRARDDLDSRHPDDHEFLPHITVSKELHDEVKAGHLTLEDLDLKIHPLEYRIGDFTARTYVPSPRSERLQTPKVD